MHLKIKGTVISYNILKPLTNYLKVNCCYAIYYRSCFELKWSKLENIFLFHVSVGNCIAQTLFNITELIVILLTIDLKSIYLCLKTETQNFNSLK